MRCFFSWQSSCGPLHILCLHSERISTCTFNWLIKPSWSELSWYSDTDLAIEAPSPLSVPRGKPWKCRMCQNTFAPTQLTAYWEETKRNQDLCVPSLIITKGPMARLQRAVQMSLLDANRVMIKLRTSIWALLSHGTLLFTRYFREGWTSIHLISIMELILPSASEVSRRLSFLDNTLGVDGYLGRPLPFWRVSEGARMMCLGWRSQHLCGGNSVRALCQHT